MCEVLARLLAACEEREKTFSEALVEHCRRGWLMKGDDDQCLRDAVEQAALDLSGAKVALRTHASAHNCIPPM
jgi:hypothetical protein